MSKYPQLKDPGIIAFLEEGERLYPANALSFTLDEQRAFYNTYCQHFAGKRPAQVKVADFKVDDVLCRCYTAPAATTQVLYLHGGGFVVGGLDQIVKEDHLWPGSIGLLAGVFLVWIGLRKHRRDPEGRTPARSIL